MADNHRVARYPLVGKFDFTGSGETHRECFPIPFYSIALLISVGVAPVLPTIHVSSWEIQAPSWPLISGVVSLLVARWIAQMATNYFQVKFATYSMVSHENCPRLSLADNERLRKWVERETPIEDAVDDLFGHTPIAKRLIERLWRGENTIALQGDYGSGKSSIIALTRHFANKQKLPLIFAQVSCWGFEKASDAQEAILSALTGYDPAGQLLGAVRKTDSTTQC